jgi:hypothetical protein
MGSHRKFEKTIRVVLVLWCLLASGPVVAAKLIHGSDYRNGSLDAELVVIVSRQSPGSFKIEEVFLGAGPTTRIVSLPGFRLATEQMYGPDIIEPITPNTKILLFLRHKKDAPADWEIVDFGHCFYWVQKPEQTEQLRAFAEKAIELRRRWQEVDSISDPVRRAEALWPFLSVMEFGLSVARHTKVALQEIVPASGDYFAERFDGMAHWDRMDLMRDAGRYGGDKLHERVKSFIQTQQKTYETYAMAHNLTGRDRDAVWNSMPVAVQDSAGDIYYGVAGLTSFRRRDDLPLIRDIARWGVKYEQQQTCEATLDAFRAMPDEENLDVISMISKKFRANGGEIFPIDVMEALETHKYVQTIPLLAPFVSVDGWGVQAEAVLTGIVGKDLGPKPGPWLVWYKNQVP